MPCRTKPRSLFAWILDVASRAVLISSWLLPCSIFADEYPILTESTAIGRNYGVPMISAISPYSVPGDLDFAIESVVFAKNLELTGYPTDEINGETFFGVILPTRLIYRAGPQTQIEVGALLARDFGTGDGFSTSEPLLRIVAEHLPQHYLIAGSLIRTHWIHDGLYDDVFAFRQPHETGIQYRIDAPHWKQDSWIDWRIQELPDRSERFEGANATQLRFGQLFIDGQIYWSHSGGQKNTENLVENNVSGMLGFSLGFGEPWSSDTAGRIGVDYLLGVDEDDDFGDGIEYWARYDLPRDDTRWLRLFAKHFSGSDFHARRGDPLYQFDNYSQAGANVVCWWDSQLQLEAGFVGQIVDGTFMHTYQIHLAWGGRFRLGHLPNQRTYSTTPLVIPTDTYLQPLAEDWTVEVAPME